MPSAFPCKLEGQLRHCVHMCMCASVDMNVHTCTVHFYIPPTRHRIAWLTFHKSASGWNYNLSITSRSTVLHSVGRILKIIVVLISGALPHASLLLY